MNGKMRLFGIGSQILSQRDRFLRINKKIIGTSKLATDICSLRPLFHTGVVFLVKGQTKYDYKAPRV